MKKNKAYYSILIFIAAVWLINGLFCKVLNLVPRHEAIVAKILGPSHSRFFTILIGISEIGMSIWVLSRIKPRLCAFVQILVIVAMNILEFILVPDLLLWGRWNALFAFMLLLIIYFNEFYLRKANSSPN